MPQNNTPEKGDEISLFDLLQVIADNLRLLVLGPMIAGLLALGYSFTITPTYTATTKFLPPQQQQSAAAGMLASLGGLAGVATGLKSSTDQYTAFLKSRTLQDALVDRLKLMERLDTKSRQDARSAISGSILITTGKDGLITIEASDKDPTFAAQLANAHVEELGKLTHHFAITEAKQRRIFLEGQLENAKNNLRQAEQTLNASGINSSVLKSSGAALAEVAGLKGQITAQEIKLASMRGYLTEAAPDFKQAQTELAALRAQLDRIEKAEPASTDSNTGNTDYIAKYRNFKYYETLFALFKSQYDTARIDERREADPIQVVDVAVPPDRNSKPQRVQMVIFTTLGAGIALLLMIFIRHASLNSIKTPDTAAKLRRLNQALGTAFGRSPKHRA